MTVQAARASVPKDRNWSFQTFKACWELAESLVLHSLGQSTEKSRGGRSHLSTAAVSKNLCPFSIYQLHLKQWFSGDIRITWRACSNTLLAPTSQIPDSVGLSWGSRICISGKLPGTGAFVACLGNHTWRSSNLYQ